MRLVESLSEVDGIRSCDPRSSADFIWTWPDPEPMHRPSPCICISGFPSFINPRACRFFCERDSIWNHLILYMPSRQSTQR
jgi:hypothetical protein